MNFKLIHDVLKQHSILYFNLFCHFKMITAYPTNVNRCKRTCLCEQKRICHDNKMVALQSYRKALIYVPVSIENSITCAPMTDSMNQLFDSKSMHSTSTSCKNSRFTSTIPPCQCVVAFVSLQDFHKFKSITRELSLLLIRGKLF